MKWVHPPKPEPADDSKGGKKTFGAEDVRARVQPGRLPSLLSVASGALHARSERSARVRWGLNLHTQVARLHVR
eukprot:4135333-Alexandrium_andersonii.AAC.1